MASIYDLKPRFQSLLRPLVAGLVRRGATPNGVTLAALLGSIGAGATVAFAASRPALLLVLPVWLFLRMALNALDGMMAREHGMASPLGAALNELGDVVSDIALYLPLALVEPRAALPVVAFAIAGVLSEYAGLLGVALGSTRRYEGPMGKSDRAFVVGALGLVTFFVPAAVQAWPWVFGAGAALGLWSCWNRVRAALADAASRAVRHA